MHDAPEEERDPDNKLLVEEVEEEEVVHDAPEEETQIISCWWVDGENLLGKSASISLSRMIRFKRPLCWLLIKF